MSLSPLPFDGFPVLLSEFWKLAGYGKRMNFRIRQVQVVLGIPHNATIDQARQAYFSKLKIHHPDRMPLCDLNLQKQAHEETIVINDAYHAVSATIRRDERSDTYVRV